MARCCLDGEVAGSWFCGYIIPLITWQRTQLPLSATSLSPSSFSAILYKKTSAMRALEAWDPSPMRASCEAQEQRLSASPHSTHHGHNQRGHAVLKRTLTQKKKVLEGTLVLRKHLRTQLNHQSSHPQDSYSQSPELGLSTLV